MTALYLKFYSIFYWVIIHWNFIWKIDLNNGVYCDLRNKSACLNTVLRCDRFYNRPIVQRIGEIIQAHYSLFYGCIKISHMELMTQKRFCKIVHICMYVLKILERAVIDNLNDYGCIINKFFSLQLKTMYWMLCEFSKTMPQSAQHDRLWFYCMRSHLEENFNILVTTQLTMLDFFVRLSQKSITFVHCKLLSS